MLDQKKYADLTIDFKALFGYPSYLKIKHWKEGVDWVLFVEKEVPEVREYLKEAAVPIEYVAVHPDCKDWYQSIPEEVREKLTCYPEMGFTLLYHVNHYQAAYELFVSNPNLLWLLLRYAKAGNWTEEQVVHLLNGKRTRILEACELPATKSAVKILYKLDFDQYCIKKFCKIQEGLSLSEYAKLNHHQSVGFDLFCVLIRFPYLIGTPLMLTYNIDIWSANDEMTLVDIDLVAIRLDQQEGVRIRLKQCKSMQEARHLHDRLVVVLNKKEISGLPNDNFPIPPIEGNKTIIPITGTQNLAREGQEQHHCVRGYAQKVVEGSYYVYKVVIPERATLGLQLHKNSPPTVDQLLLNCNQSVSKETRSHIDKWLLKSIAETVQNFV